MRERAEKLGIPQAIQESAQGFDAVLLLLAEEYLLMTQDGSHELSNLGMMAKTQTVA